MSDPKFCKDCQWFVQDLPPRPLVHSVCSHPSTVSERSFNLVTGERATPSFPLCADERSTGACGRAGQRFQPVEQQGDGEPKLVYDPHARAIVRCYADGTREIP